MDELGIHLSASTHLRNSVKWKQQTEKDCVQFDIICIKLKTLLVHLYTCSESTKLT